MAQTIKNLLVIGETPVLILGSGRSPGEGNGDPLQYFCLENPMDRGSWWALVHGVTTAATNTFTFIPFILHMLAPQLSQRGAVIGLGWRNVGFNA